MVKKLLTIMLSVFLMVGILTTNNNVYADDGPVTVGDILGYTKRPFPTSVEDGWQDPENDSLYINNNSLYINLNNDGQDYQIIDLNATLDYGDWLYSATDGNGTIYFVFSDYDPNVLDYIEYDGNIGGSDFYNSFNPLIYMTDFFGENFDTFPRTFEQAYTDGDGHYAYINDNALQIYDNNVEPIELIDSFDLDTKLPPSFPYPTGTNGGYFGSSFLYYGTSNNMLIDEINYYNDDVDWYLKASYNKISQIMPITFPLGDDSSVWKNENGISLRVYLDLSNALYFELTDSNFEDYIYILDRDGDLTISGSIYTCNVIGTDSESSPNIILNIDTNNKIESIEVSGYDTDYINFNGTYEPPASLSVSEIVLLSKKTFPTSTSEAWRDDSGNLAYKNGDNLILDFVSETDVSIPLNDSTVIITLSATIQSYALSDNSNIVFNVHGQYFDEISYKLNDDYFYFHPFVLDIIIPDYFPNSLNDAWVNKDKDIKMYYEDKVGLHIGSEVISCDDILTYENDEYILIDELCSLKFIYNSYNRLVEIEVYNADGTHENFEGAYEPIVTVEDILKTSKSRFPELPLDGWKIDGGDYYAYISNDNLNIGNPYSIPLNTPLVRVGDDYKFTGTFTVKNTDNTINVLFKNENDFLKSIILSDSISEGYNGEYVPHYVQIDDKIYSSLEEAIENAQDNDTITLIRDCYFYDDTQKIEINNKKITIDCNDGSKNHSLNFPTNDGSTYDFFTIKNHSQIEIKNCFFNGNRFTGANIAMYINVFNVENLSSLTLNNCKCKNAYNNLIVNNGSVLISGGEYENTKYLQLNGSFKIDGGTFNNCPTLITAGNSSSADNNVGTIEVSNASIFSLNSGSTININDKANVIIDNVSFKDTTGVFKPENTNSLVYFNQKSYKSSLEIKNLISDSPRVILLSNSSNLSDLRVKIDGGKFKYLTGYFCNVNNNVSTNYVDTSKIVSVDHGYFAPITSSQANNGVPNGDPVTDELNNFFDSTDHTLFTLNKDSDEYKEGYRYAIMKKYDTTNSIDEPIFPFEEPIFYTNIPYDEFYTKPNGPIKGHIEIDGNIVPDGSYEYEEGDDGKLIIKLKETYLDDITPDIDHTLTIVSDDGITTPNFVIKSPPNYYPSDEPIFNTNIPFDDFYTKPSGPIKGTIIIDGTILPDGSYEYKEGDDGKLIIKLKENYLDDITPDEKHTLAVKFGDNTKPISPFILKQTPSYYPSDEPIFYTDIPYEDFYTKPNGPIIGHIEIDGVTIPDGSYEFFEDENGKLFIKLTKTYLGGITPNSEHILTVVSQNGTTKKSKFNLKASPNPSDDSGSSSNKHIVLNTGVYY